MDFEDAIRAHSDWKRKLRAAITEKQQLDAHTISADGLCVLGKWLHGEAQQKFGQLPSHQACVSKHAAFHYEAGKIAHLVNEMKFAEAEAALFSTSYQATTQEVVAAIMEIMKDMGQ